MNQPSITALIDKDGKITLDVNGVQGKGCEALTKQLEEALGQVEGRTLKPEHFIKPAEGKLTARN